MDQATPTRPQKTNQWIPAKGSPQRILIVLSATATALLVVPFFFWFFTWYGWSLDTSTVDSALAEPVKPGLARQQVMLIGEKLSRQDKSVSRWYPRIVALAAHPDADLRGTVAWLMGKDTAPPEFHQALKVLLRDPVPQVRRTAALSLANFRDPLAREELTLITQPYTVKSTVSGVTQMRILPGDTCHPTTIVARVNGIDIPAAVEGKVSKNVGQDGAEIKAGEPLVEIQPEVTEADQARRALRNLASK